HAVAEVAGLEQRDLAPRDGAGRSANTLVAHRRLPGDAEPERVSTEGEAVLQPPHDEADLVDAGQHGLEERARRADHRLGAVGFLAPDVEVDAAVAPLGHLLAHLAAG